MWDGMGELLILAYKGNSLFSTPIKAISGSKFSHMGILLLDNFQIFETDVMKRVSINNLSYCREDYEIYRYKNLTRHQKELMYSYMISKIGEKYSMYENLRYYLSHKFNIRLPDDNRQNCIELTYDTFLYAGIDLVTHKEEPYIFEDILENENLECFY